MSTNAPEDYTVAGVIRIVLTLLAAIVASVMKVSKAIHFVAVSIRE